jgi:hypothetical protein
MNLRSLHLRQLASLQSVSASKDVQFFSLQMEEPAKQLIELQNENWPGPHVIDMTRDLKDWADTAALIANLDLVITCDTGVAHLAAAMGKRTWVLLHHSACWRWLQARDDSPWYPTVRLFRQPQRGDWTSAVSNVVLALDDLVNSVHN